MVGVFLKNHVLELKKNVFENQKGHARKRAIEKSWIIPVDAYVLMCVFINP